MKAKTAPTRIGFNLPVLLLAIVLLGASAHAGPPYVLAAIPDTNVTQGDTLVMDMYRYFEDGESVELGYFHDADSTKIDGVTLPNGQLRLWPVNGSTPGNVRVIVTTIDDEQFTAVDTFMVKINKGPGIRASVQAARPAHIRLQRGETALFLRTGEPVSGVVRVIDLFGRNLLSRKIRQQNTITVPLAGGGSGARMIMLTTPTNQYTWRIALIR